MEPLSGLGYERTFVSLAARTDTPTDTPPTRLRALQRSE